MTATVLELLAALGDTELEVAVSLRERGIKGTLKRLTCCPVANYLHAEGRPCAVYPGFVSESLGGPGWRTSIPFPVVVFMIAFDEGAYPDLVSENP